MVTHRPANPKAAGLRPRARPGRKPQKVERTRVDPGRRLLDVGKTTVPQQAIHSTDTNDRNSPLLKIPAEVRLVILGYVLGDLAIEVVPDRDYLAVTPLMVRVCAGSDNCPNSSLSSSDALRLRSDSLWRRSYGLDNSPLNLLNILLVCRRIYQEAALLPFQLNTLTLRTVPSCWKFASSTIKHFLDNLARDQREALAHLTLISDSCALKDGMAQLARLKGLRTLHIVQRPDLGRTPTYIVQRPDRGLAPIYNAISFGWKYAGSRPVEIRRLELRHLQAVRFSLEVRFSGDWAGARGTFEKSVVAAQTRDLTRSMRLVEARLFETLATRPMPVKAGEERDEEGGYFKERLDRLRVG